METLSNIISPTLALLSPKFMCSLVWLPGCPLLIRQEKEQQDSGSCQDDRSAFPLRALLSIIFHFDSQKSTLNPATPSTYLHQKTAFLWSYLWMPLWLDRNASSRPASAKIPKQKGSVCLLVTATSAVDAASVEVAPSTYTLAHSHSRTHTHTHNQMLSTVQAYLSAKTKLQPVVRQRTQTP